MEKRKKQKGRPSLLHLQKRLIIKDQHHHQQPKPNHHPNSKTINITPTSNLRSTRRNPNPSSTPSSDNTHATEEDEDDGGKLRKLKVVVKLPAQRSQLNSASLNLGAENNVDGTNHKKQKLNGIGDESGTGYSDTEKAEKHVTKPISANTSQGTQLEMGPSTSLPDKQLLLYILDRLQKKDTYGVFAEPVDPEELPDYHEVVEHPMDFGTVRKNLSSGAYASLGQFERDIFLICSNAMQYNSPETIYFRQARYIQEMAKKYFKDLRQESEDNEPERKIVRRGRPSTKNLKKQIVKPPLQCVGSRFSDATIAAGANNTIRSNFDLIEGPVDQNSQRSAEITDSVLQRNWMKRAKKQFAVDEIRRNTYQETHISSGARKPSVLTTFDGQRKQLMVVGLRTEHGYARSLARFGANLGPVAWKILSNRIEKSLPAGVKFGPGWVGDIEEIQLKSSSSSSLSKPLSQPENSCVTPRETKSEKPSDISEGNKVVGSTHSPGINGEPNKLYASSIAQPHWQYVSVQKNKGTIQPDLNIRFQSPGSPSSCEQD